MGIKSKKSKLYSMGAKMTALVLMLVSTIAICANMMFVLDLRYEKGMSPFIYDDYFETAAFNNQYSQLVRDVVNVNMVYKSEENIKAGNALNRYMLIEEFVNNNQLEVNTLVESESGPEVTFNNQDDLDYFKKYYASYEKQAIQDQLNEFNSSIKELKEYINVGYYLKDTKTNDIISNMDLSTIESQKINSYIDGPFINGHTISNTNYYYEYNEDGSMEKAFYYNNFQDSVEKILLKNNYTLNIAVMDNLREGDPFYTQYWRFDYRKDMVPTAVTAAILFAVIDFILLIYMMVTAGKKSKDGTVSFLPIDRMYNDIHFIIVFLVAIMSAGLAFMLIGNFYSVARQWVLLVQIFICTLIVIDWFIAVSYLTGVVRQVRGKQFFRNTVAGAIIRGIASLFTGKTFKGWIVLGIGVFAIVNLILGGFMASNSGLAVIAFFIFNIVCGFFILRALRSLTKIMIAVKETSKGDLAHDLDISTISPSFVNFAKDVSEIQNGLKRAVGEAIKGERMKTELITNVSHDLKTPLTSIVTYVDLLKKEKLDNEKANEYIAVLDEKSYRLKQLIEDLIEASKASSGNLAVNYERVDLRQLVLQACGEFEEKIEKGGFTFKINSEADTAVHADGRHMWRIVENLISNTLKYSMPNSRIYIDILKDDAFGSMVIKNISAIQIDVTPEQLTERFVRGDSSRTTEGSGLGLSIAQSLTEIQGGTMDIEIDGDLFKVTVKMPLWNDEMIEG